MTYSSKKSIEETILLIYQDRDALSLKNKRIILRNLLFKLFEDEIYKAYAFNLPYYLIYDYCCLNKIFKKYVNRNTFLKYFFSQNQKKEILNMSANEYRIKILLKIIQSSKKIKRNVIPVLLNCYISEIFDLFPSNLKIDPSKHSSLIYNYLIQLEPALSIIKEQTFYLWLKNFAKNQDEQRKYLEDNQSLKKQNISPLNNQLQQLQNNSSSSYSNNLSSVEIAPVNFSDNQINRASAGAISTENNDEWSAPDIEQNRIISDSVQIRKRDYEQKRTMFCPKPILPLTPLSPEDPQYPFEKKYDGFYVDKRGLIFDSLSKNDQSEWCPVPKVLELNGSYPNMKSYKWKFLDKFNSIDVISIYSNNLDSFVFEHFGENSTQKCSFYSIKKEFN